MADKKTDIGKKGYTPPSTPAKPADAGYTPSQSPKKPRSEPPDKRH